MGKIILLILKCTAIKNYHMKKKKKTFVGSANIKLEYNMFKIVSVLLVFLKCISFCDGFKIVNTRLMFHSFNTINTTMIITV